MFVTAAVLNSASYADTYGPVFDNTDPDAPTQAEWVEFQEMLDFEDAMGDWCEATFDPDFDGSLSLWRNR